LGRITTAIDTKVRSLILAKPWNGNANLENLEAALTSFDESLKLDSLNGEAYNGRAIARLKQKITKVPVDFKQITLEIQA